MWIHSTSFSVLQIASHFWQFEFAKIWYFLIEMLLHDTNFLNADLQCTSLVSRPKNHSRNVQELLERLISKF